MSRLTAAFLLLIPLRLVVFDWRCAFVVLGCVAVYLLTRWVRRGDQPHDAAANCRHSWIDNDTGRCLECDEPMIERMLAVDAVTGDEIVLIPLHIYRCKRCHQGDDSYCGEHFGPSGPVPHKTGGRPDGRTAGGS